MGHVYFLLPPSVFDTLIVFLKEFLEKGNLELEIVFMKHSAPNHLLVHKDGAY